MKINWGTGIVIAFGIFITFILSFVFRVQSNPEYDNEMVTDNYYVKDTKYGEQLEKMQRAADLKLQPTIKSVKEGIEVSFPQELAQELSKGEVSLYRPSDKKFDFQVPLNLSESVLLIPDSRLVGGLWGITITAEREGKTLIWERKIYR